MGERKMKRMIVLVTVLTLLAGLAVASPALAVDVGDTLDMGVTYRDFHGVTWAGGDGYLWAPGLRELRGFRPRDRRVYPRRRQEAGLCRG